MDDSPSFVQVESVSWNVLCAGPWSRTQNESNIWPSLTSKLVARLKVELCDVHLFKDLDVTYPSISGR